MIEVLWHGRGGQGAFTAARLLGAAAMEAGLHALAFPSFGPERRGAPMRAFTKVGQAPIGDRSASSQADYVVYLDDTLFGPGWEAELKPGGRVLLNTTRAFDDSRILAFDADGLSAAVLGRPIPNTALLGALARIEPSVSLDDIGAAVRSSMASRLHEPNCTVAAQAYQTADSLLAAKGVAGDPTAAAAGAAGAQGMEGAAAADASRAESPAASPAVRPADVVRAEAHIPRLRSQFAHAPSLDPADYARSTCFAAGHLVTKNAGWRSQRPVVDEAACTACGQCVQYCPDGTIFLKSRRVGSAKPAAALAQPDLDFCKGCGICAKMCRFGAIAMVPEAEALATPAGPSVPAPESEVSA